MHTFEIELPEHVNFPAIGSCHKGKDTCQVIAHVLAQLNSIRIETGATLNRTLEIINRLVPNAETVVKSRSKRALLSFIGKFSKTLFGTATIDDVNILARHINALNKRTQSINEALVQHGEHLSSFMSMTNQRMSNLLKGVRENHLAIQYVESQVQSNAKSLSDVFDEMTGLLIQQLTVSNTINKELEDLKLGVLDLVNGKLSPLLIPIDVLQSTLNDVHTILSQNYSGFHISLDSATDLYQNAHFLYTRKQSVLYLTVKIPITYLKDAMDLYKVISVPVPVNDTSNHGTQLINMPDYFAITIDQQFYLPLSQSILSKCKGTSNVHCHINLPLVPITKDSCILSLFANDVSGIQTLCEFRFLPDAISTRIITLDMNHVLLYQSPMLSMECNGHHQMVQGCNFCLFNLSCQCSLSSPDFYLPPRLISCKGNASTPHTRMHPVNLILLQKFFDSSTWVIF